MGAGRADTRRPVALAVAFGALAGVALVGALTGCTTPSGHVRRPGVRRRSPARGAGTTVRHVVLGRSVRGRPIRAVELGDRRLPVSLLVVGIIHGNEPAGRRVAQLVEARPPPAGEHVWVIDDLNPDGVAAGTRANAQRVDLNRDFPWHWRPLPLASGQYSGPRPLYAPEARIAARLILRLRPRVTVWFHQPLDTIDLSGGDPAVERRFARLAGMRVTRLTRYPGSAASWQDHVLPSTTAFVAELPPGRLRARLAHRLAGALRALSRNAR
jgi:protein MpaA